MRSFKSRKNKWTNIKELTAPRSFLTNRLSKFAVLQSAWDKEVGPLCAYWAISAVRGATVFVKVSSSGAEQELMFQKKNLIKKLNKHFARGWIKEIKKI